MMAPPFLRFDHVGVVVKDIEAAIADFSAAVGVGAVTDRFDDAGLRVSVQFVRDRSGMTYEMISPLGADSPVGRTLASKANLLNQVAYRTASLEESAQALRDAGHFPLGAPAPALAFGGARVQFFWCALGFVIELVEGFDVGPAFREVA